MLGLVLTAASLAATAVLGNKYRQKKMSTEAKCIFDHTMETVSDPSLLEEFANKFQAAGYKAEAAILRKRAKLQSLPPETKVAVREALQVGMGSKDPKSMRKLADMMHQSGRTGAAYALREQANAVEALAKVPNAEPVTLAPVVPPPEQNPNPTAPVPSPIEPNAPTDVAPIPGGTKVEDPATKVGP